MDLVELAYVLTKKFPKEEVYGLAAQLRRAAVSVPSNIAEGQGRGPAKEFAYFLTVAHGSLRELETQMLIAQRLNYIDGQQADRFINLSSEVGGLIIGLKKIAQSISSITAYCLLPTFPACCLLPTLLAYSPRSKSRGRR